jgi:phage baseplate assembly protein W
MSTTGINIAFPFQETQDGGVFSLNSTTQNAVRDDLIALLTLKRGQRPMRNTMYSPIFDYIGEPLDDTTQRLLDSEIREKVSQFIPQIVIKTINFTPKPEENLLGIRIIFTITELFGSEQVVELNIPTEETDRISNSV